MPTSTFAAAIAPLTSEAFFRQHWREAYFLQQQRSNRFSDLLPWSDINRILAMEPPSIRVAKDGVTIPESVYSTIRSKTRNEYKYGEFMDLLRSGATLIINNVDKFHAPVRALAADFEKSLSEYVQVNLYAGWGTSKGFDLHWDDHDVFIFHLHGHKQWKVYNQSRPWPVTQDRDAGRKFNPPASPIWEGVLAPGDLLYMPRGWWHVAVPLAEPTAHLTFGVKHRTGLDFFGWLNGQLSDQLAFRRDIPQHGVAETPQEYVSTLKFALDGLITVENISRYLAEYSGAARAKPLFDLPWSASAERIPSTSRLWLVPLNPRVAAVDRGSNGVITITMCGNQYSFNERAGPILEKLFSSGGIEFSSLLACCGWTEAELSALVVQLVTLSLITVSELPGTDGVTPGSF
jgi:ribosomal protein L16 Arg81 hydroxylase